MPASLEQVRAPPRLPAAGLPAAGLPAAGAAALGDSWRDALAAQLAEAVLEQVECRAAAAEESLWLRGQQEICSIREEHAAQKHQMQHQLSTCAEICRGLEQENAVLRRGIEVIVKHLGQVRASHAPAPAPRSAGPALGHAAARYRRAQLPGLADARRLAASEDFFIPCGPPICEEQEEDADSDDEGAPLSVRSREEASTCSPGREASTCSPVSRGSRSGSPASVSEATTPDSGSASEGSETFSFTLRRAPDVPLGLEVCGDDGHPGLTVRAVRPGGAVEAWNRQMPAGDRREVRVGDHIVKVNDAQDAKDMRDECVRATLLRIVVVHPAAEPTACFI